MEQPAAYIPMDRRHALMFDQPLPEHVMGAVLLADISGFTPLTEALVQELGPRRGAEELTGHLNRVYDALIAELHHYGGCVISFAGDAIICWLDGDDGRRAVACALAMQEAIKQFAEVTFVSGSRVTLAMKTAVTTGPVRRFVIGDPSIQLIDVLAGNTLERLSLAAHLAEKGDVVLTPETAVALQPHLELRTWRPATSTGEEFALVARLSTAVSPQPWPLLPHALTADQIRSWLLPAVYDQLQYGSGQFLAELRPATALFVQFTGIDYDQEADAPAKLDAFIREVQRIVAHYDGALLQLTVGDKGNYLYAAFGAPVAHEDDAARAVATAWEIQQVAAEMPAVRNVRIGIAAGRMRTGAYGGAARRTYGVLGDSVNLSARLMEKAAPGQILVTQEIQLAADDRFEWEMLPPMPVKGKSGPVSAAAVVGPRQRSTLRLLEPDYALPMVGRQQELMLMQQKLASVLAGQGQIVGITAEAGMGKSRLVAEIIRLAKEQGLIGFGGECQSIANRSSYHVWHTIWRGFFSLSADMNADEYVARLEAELTQIDPALLPRLPLLSAVLNLPIADNALTRTFDAKLRKSSLESLLVACLRARAAERPLLLVLEDSHWIDPLSHDLLEIVGRAMADTPIFLVLAYRIVEVGGDLPPRVAPLPYFQEIMLTEFTPQEAAHLMQLKMAQLFGTDTAVSPKFIQIITEKAEGNPFYIEELINYLQDRHINPQDVVALELLELPDSLHSLILSRIDQLSESQKNTLKIASVIGRLFQAAILWGAYPELGEASHVRADLDAMRQLDLTALDSPEPELTYIFKHVVTQEATYESLPYSTRARLHTQIGDFIEQTYQEVIQPFVPVLAHHFWHGEDETRKRKYLLLAAADASQKYAHETAVSYYDRALPLTPKGEKVAVLRQLGDVLQPVGRWTEAEAVLEEALTLARELGDLRGRAACQLALAELLRKQGRFDDAAARLMRARLNYEELQDEVGLGQVLHSTGTLVAQQGDYERARTLYEQSLAIRRRLDDQTNIANLLNNMGVIARFQGEAERARELYEESLSIRQQLDDKWAISVSLNNLGYLALNQGDLETARQRLEAAVLLTREVGDRWSIGNSMNNLANVARDQGDLARARELYHESLQINQELGDKRAVAYLLEDVGCLALAEGQFAAAVQLVAAATAVREEIGAPLAPNDQKKLDTMLAPAHLELPEEACVQATAVGRASTLAEAVAYALRV